MKDTNKLTIPNEELDFLQSIVNKHYDNVKCSKCNDTGTVKTEKGIGFCSCWLEKIWAEKAEEALIPNAYTNLTLNDWNPTKDGNGEALSLHEMELKQRSREFLQVYLKNIPSLCASKPRPMKLINRHGATVKITNLKLIGGHGSGKTMVAALIGVEAIKKGLNVKFYNWPELIHVLSSYDYRQTQDEILKEFKEFDIIIIDDLVDYGNKNQSLRIQLDRLAYARISLGKPLIITLSQEYKTLDTPIFGRLLDSCFSIKLPNSAEFNK